MSEGQPRLVDNDPWVFSGGEINFDYPTGILKPEAPEGGPSIRVIFVGQVEDRFLVCLPSTVWHKKTANRKLPAGTLVKATPVSVAACNEADRTLVDEETSFKVWLGYLDADLVDVTELGDLTTECSEDFHLQKLWDNYAKTTLPSSLLERRHKNQVGKAHLDRATCLVAWLQWRMP